MIADSNSNRRIFQYLSLDCVLRPRRPVTFQIYLRLRKQVLIAFQKASA
jgi:hypothetical protein